MASIPKFSPMLAPWFLFLSFLAFDHCPGRKAEGDTEGQKGNEGREEGQKGRKAKAAVARREPGAASHGGLSTSGIRRAKAVAQVAARKGRAKANSTSGVASIALVATVR